MPVNEAISEGIRMPGCTRVLHSSTISPCSSRTMPTSMTRCCAAIPPVVSRSTQATGPRNDCDRSAIAAAVSCMRSARGTAIQRQERVIELGATVTEDAPSVTLQAQLVEIERGGQHGFRLAVGLRHFATRAVGDERRAVKRHCVLLALLQ